ncbi:MAG: hypothetical protein IPM38_00330 [Ignavibacteria bacterium]|nr:hypothetical protein [Ignavibacteria bacterium]
MKTLKTFQGKVFFSFILLLSVLSLFFTRTRFNKIESSNSVSAVNPLDSFVLGAMDDAYAFQNRKRLSDSLKFNTWHTYSRIDRGWTLEGYNGDPDDLTFADSSDYYQGIKALIDTNSRYNLKTIMDRPKIAYLAWGQRSDYQCEEIISDNDYWFYTYKTHSNLNMQDVVDTGIHGSGERVRYCQPHPSNPSSNSGWVVKDLKANREQINHQWNFEKNDTAHNWHILPRIRIDSGFAASPLNFNKQICRIDILNFRGDTIRSVNLKVSNFVYPNIDSIYHGNYLEKYFRLHNDSNLIISPGKLFNPDKNGLGDTTCKVDFRVWYYGECEMWIDRVRVENEVAHELFNGDHEEWLRWECNLAMEHPDYIRNFYIEEFEFNAIPCIKYVNQKIRLRYNP